MIEKLALVGLSSVALYFLFKSNFAKASVDNALISTGVAEKTEVIAVSSDIIAIANKNPLNIRESSDNWQGLDYPRASKGFFRFKEIYWCYRAAARIILGAYAKRGVKTLEKIIYTWAPPEDNNETQKYIDFVVKKSGLSRSTIIDKTNINKMLYAMTIIESGKAESFGDIDKGVALA